MIAAGGIDIGRAISRVPSKPDHKMEDNEKEVYGRLISLKNIRLKHLKLMKEKGLLRKTNTEKMTKTECMRELDKRKG